MIRIANANLSATFVANPPARRNRLRQLCTFADGTHGTHGTHRTNGTIATVALLERNRLGVLFQLFQLRLFGLVAERISLQIDLPERREPLGTFFVGLSHLDQDGEIGDLVVIQKQKLPFGEPFQGRNVGNRIASQVECVEVFEIGQGLEILDLIAVQVQRPHLRQATDRR